jgi:hypothetical protein
MLAILPGLSCDGQSLTVWVICANLEQADCCGVNQSW